MHRTWSLTGVAAVVWLSITQGAQPATFPKGTFTASRQKDWSIKFEDKGKFSVIRDGKIVVEGAYKATETELTLTDEKGPLVAKDESAKTGKYRWKLDAGKLRFTVVEDKSRGRELLLTMNEWLDAK